MRTRKWDETVLKRAVQEARSLRRALLLLGLRPAGGNYVQVAKYIKKYKLDTSHFTGSAWNKGMRGIGKPRLQLDAVLTTGSSYQSYQLKRRLFSAGLKLPRCELCGWAKLAADGRLPLELDHINGDRQDNRIENLRILCPNCHSLQLTHRGLNRKKH